MNMNERMEIFKLAQSYKIDWELVLPNTVYDAVRAHARSLGCELDVLMLPLFVSVATFMGPQTKIRITECWTEHPSLLAIVAARRGERKTTVLKHIKKCSQNTQTEHQVQETKGDENELPKTGLQEISCIDDVTETCNVRGSRLFVIDDLEEILQHVTKVPSFWNVGTLQRTVISPCCYANLSSSLNVIAVAQGTAISDIINYPDPGRLLDRVLVICARDMEIMNISLKQSIPIQTILQRVHDMHNKSEITYTFSEDVAQEFERMSGITNSIKTQCHNDELKRGCANHVLSQVVRLSAVCCAFTSAIADSKADYIIPRSTVQSMFVLSLFILRQKCLLLHGSDTTTYSELFHSILTSEVELLKPKEAHTTENEDDVIEITLDGNNEPVARIIPKRDDKAETPSTGAPQSSDVTIWSVDDAHQNERNISNMFYSSGTNSQEILDYQKQQGTTSAIQSRETVNLQHYDQNQVSQNDSQDHKQNNSTSLLRPRGKIRPLPPPLKPRPYQLHVNRRFIPAPKRLNDRTQPKTCVFTCSDSIFVQICYAKIRKCLLTKGLYITSSYACQYRLFPPVPLGQRTSSPRTTHPSWAAVKFFERLESLGFGEVMVFRSQSVKFKKKSLEVMPERARTILKQIGVADDDYRSAMTVDDGISHGSLPEYNYIFTVHPNGSIETEETVQQVQG